MSFFVTTICTVTMDPHFVYSSSSSYMSRFLWPSSIEMCRKSMYFPYSGMGYRACMFRSDVVNSKYHGFWYWYFKSSSMSSRTSGSPPSKLHTMTDDRARLSRTAFTSSVGMSFQWFLMRSEEHTSELQSRGHLVCRLLLEKKKKNKTI